MSIRKLPLLLSLIFLSFIGFEKRKTTVYMIGDSTMAVKDIKTYPETGWGMPFSYFFDSTVVVDNRAKNGRSSKSFIAEKLWQPVLENLNEGDYVFIQFGHNDESIEKKERYSTPEEFKTNLIRYITETRSKKAIPVLLTPVSRRNFDSTGHIKETHAVYSKMVVEVAAESKVAFIDMDTKSRELLQKFGPENSKLLFLHMEPGEHPNYPDGKADNTHFNELGARKMAQLVLPELKRLGLGLAEHIRLPVTSKK